jgi:hypothetical protein
VKGLYPSLISIELGANVNLLAFNDGAMMGLAKAANWRDFTRQKVD